MSTSLQFSLFAKNGEVGVLRWASKHAGVLVGFVIIFQALLSIPNACASTAFVPPIVQSSPFLAPAKAFRFTAHMAPDNQIVLQWTAAPHYHLYRNRITLQVSPTSVRLGPYHLPPGKPLHIPGVGTLAVYEGVTTTVRVPVHFVGTPPHSFQVISTFQGCANAGVCYPVERKAITLIPTAAALSTVPFFAAPATPQPSHSAPPTRLSQKPVASGLYRGPLRKRNIKPVKLLRRAAAADIFPA
ncbi:protein-disulfide reductase DsbD N-terminal domain-containing protein [Acidithiobacillus sp. IBUN Pt1247-S3]|uniref:protein-disulfide reductase DsbD N-terminal domain-containing protein n=1 Tax=Acidithiobacillus sp. IBUN Pt1247-S3 TaxID=3166642 RepID=UPI0034E5B136